MNLENTLKEMALEIGTKDGKAGYRSFVDGKMLDKTPPEHAKLGNAIIHYLNTKGMLNKFAKFDASVIDVKTNADGSVDLFPEDGITIHLSKDKLALIVGE